jgi:hypothetical protein
MENKLYHSESNLSFKNIIQTPKYSPNSPLKKSPFIKIKLECRNLEKALLSASNITTLTNPNNKLSTQLNPYIQISLNKQKRTTNSIFHNSPKWLEEFELEIINNKTDMIELEIFSKGKRILNTSTGKMEESNEDCFLGFQILTLKYLEKTNRVGDNNALWLRLINKPQNEYFVIDSKHVLNKENHEPENYRIDESLVKRENDSKQFKY